MAIHSTPASMLKESLDETLEASRYCATYKKTDTKWGEFNTGGCLGYPSAILLFSLIDSLGSYFRKNKSFKMSIDGNSESINGTGWEHFKILNSKYFNQNLPKAFIKTLYNSYRSRLTHNSVLGKDVHMIPDNSTFEDLADSNSAFISETDTNGKTYYLISILELFNLCEKAVQDFKLDIDNVVPNSKSGNKFV